MKKSYVESLEDGARVDDVFLLASKGLSRTRDGSPFVRLRLSDRTGVIDAVMWDTDESVYANLPIDDFVHVRGLVTTYCNRLQIVVDACNCCADKLDPADFLPKSERDVQEMLDSLLAIVRSIREPHLARILESFFADEQFLDRFCAAPAAAKIHHAYLGGLLEHTLSVAQSCEHMASHYPKLKRDLLLAGALLHDVGKIEELSWSRSIRYSDAGHLVGHVVIGHSMVEQVCRTIPDIPPMLKLELLHMILSHHGEKEWGAAKRPKSLQAIVLHYVDDLDAKVNIVLTATRPPGKGKSDTWTDRHWVLDRPLLRGLPEAPHSAVIEQIESGPDGGELEL